MLVADNFAVTLGWACLWVNHISKNKVNFPCIASALPSGSLHRVLFLKSSGHWRLSLNSEKSRLDRSTFQLQTFCPGSLLKASLDFSGWSCKKDSNQRHNWLSDLDPEKAPLSLFLLSLTSYSNSPSTVLSFSLYLHLFVVSLSSPQIMFLLPAKEDTHLSFHVFPTKSLYRKMFYISTFEYVYVYLNQIPRLYQKISCKVDSLPSRSFLQ